MDYGLAALKLFCVHLKRARKSPSENAFSLGGILFQRIWLQGIIVSAPSEGGENRGYLLDDGTGIIELHIYGEFRNHRWEVGMYVMVVGGYSGLDGDLPVIKVHKIIDLSEFPDRESMWYLEVIEVFELFYRPLFED
ncbi:hypothetical protein M569_05503 [Genlisea aurea]|uniref:OB domain-containing protein n=1 Tax=Genlisea aurea TaxID=192259 RepID=S8CR47_9LAMI|nr:hypothetical protein M569_05503 [Genlisea aurea]